MAFLDWEKIFDRIDRTLLWQKLFSTNVSSKFIISLRSMYTSVKSSVRYKKKSDPISSSSLMCLFFLNDILDNIRSDLEGIIKVDNIQLFLLLFADDAVVFAKKTNRYIVY